MAEEAKPAPAVEVKPEVKTEEKAPAAEVKAETIGDVLETKDKKEKKEETVPLAAFLEVKNDNKELRKDLTALQRKIEAGATTEDVKADIDAIGEEFGVDKNFLKKLASAIRKEADKDAEEKLATRIKPIEEKERAAKIDKVFNEHFKKAMAEMPEYADIVNPDVIKALSLQPSNQNKTFPQLIEETYRKALPAGKRTLETTTPRGGKSPEAIDFDRARKDPKYFDEIMADPDLKKEYNANLTERIGSTL
jgi:hypothetical protein